MLGRFESLDGQVDGVFRGSGMEVEEEPFKERPPFPGEFVLGEFIRIVTQGRGARRVLGGGLAKELGIFEDRIKPLLGAAGGFVALEADVAFELFEGGDKAIRMEQGGATAKVPAYGLVEFQEVALEGGEVGRRRRGGAPATKENGAEEDQNEYE
jgi:hypothetical protein